jgi:hypothetical protein
MVKEYGLSAFVPSSSKLGFNLTESILFVIDTLLHKGWMAEKGESNGHLPGT